MFDKNRLANHIGKCALLLLSAVTAYYASYYMALYMPQSSDYDRRGGNALAIAYSLMLCTVMSVGLMIYGIISAIDIIYSGVDWYLGKPSTLSRNVGMLLFSVVSTGCMLSVIYYSSVHPVDIVIWGHYATWYALTQLSSLAICGVLCYSVHTITIVFNEELVNEYTIKRE